MAGTLVHRLSVTTFMVGLSVILLFDPAPPDAVAQGGTGAALDARPVDRLRTERAEVVALLADIDDGDTYIIDPRVGLSGPEQGNFLQLPVPIDSEALTNMVTLAMVHGGGTDPSLIQQFVEDVRRETRETRSALTGLLARYDAAIARQAPVLAARTQGAAPSGGVPSGRVDDPQPVNTSDADALYAQAEDMTAAERCAHGQVFGADSCEPGPQAPAAELLFQPRVYQSVVDWFDTWWGLEVAGDELEGAIEIGEIGRRWDSEVQFEFEATFRPSDGTTPIPVRGTYDLGIVTMSFSDHPYAVRLNGTLSAETGEIEGTAYLSSRGDTIERAWSARR